MSAGLPPPAEQLREVRAAARANPRSADDLYNLGLVLTRIGELAEAERALRHAYMLAPRDRATRHALGLCLLSAGRMAEGWQHYAARQQAASAGTALPANLPMPRWQGEPLADRHVVVLPEQGLGDQIQFARFVPDLVARGAKVTLVAHAPLAGLFRESFPTVDVVVADRVSSLPKGDVWASIIDCYDPARIADDTLWRGAYLDTATRWTTAPRGRLIGVVTAGNPRHPNDGFRSLSPDVGRELRARLPGRVIELDPRHTGVPSFTETAAIIAGLDVLVSIDSAAAHLAGAMGKPCMLLLPGYDTDWRWRRGRDDTPWYPHHRLYRGTPDGAWGSALDRLVADLDIR